MSTKNYFKILAIILPICFMATTINAQEGKRAKADNFFATYDYAKAIPLYEQLKERDGDLESLLLPLADAYYFNANWKKTVENYQVFQEMGNALPAQQVFRYIHALKALGAVPTANKVASDFLEIHKGKENEPFWTEIEKSLVPTNNLKTALRIIELGINSPYADMIPSFFEDGLVFASARDTGKVSRKIHGWNQKPFLDLYQVPLVGGNEVGVKARKLSGDINSKWHDSSPAFSKDGKTMYFTRNLVSENKDEVPGLGLFIATQNANGDWDTESLPFNDTSFSNAHPALSPDGKTLYFSSDRPGGFGYTDLYRVAIAEDGSYGKPMNMGKEINTAGHDSFPFIDAEGRFFFATNGHPGYGGLDVFVVGLGKGAPITPIFNLGGALNSIADDFSFIVNTENGKGFVTSNRKGGKGDDDIYGVTLMEPLRLSYLLEGIVVNSKTDERLPQTAISFIDDKVIPNSETISDAEGSFKVTLPMKERTYTLKAMKDGFIPKTQDFSAAQVGAEPFIVYLDSQEDLAELLALDPIYFDFDKATILQVSKGTLDILVSYLKENSNVSIQIRSHTDSRGNDGYNLALSGARALETKKYLEAQGISPTRLTAKGLGEGELKNRCENGVDCSEDEHRLNRRSEFIVVTKR